MVRDLHGYVPPCRREQILPATMHLVPVTTIEEVEVALVSMRIAWQRGELRELKRQLAPLEDAFTAFEQRVAAQSGTLAAERDRLRHICSELERYTARLHARLIADPDGHMSSVFTPDELRSIGELCGVDVPESWFGNEDLQTATSGDGWYTTDNDWFEEPDPEATPESREEAEELRTLYRQLAKTFHPDLTEDETERSFRQEVMLRINHAWQLRDLHAMREIGADVKDLVNGQLMSVVAHRLAWHRRELVRLEDECHQLRTRIASLRSSKTVALWHNSTLANAAIVRHVSRLQQEISNLTTRRESALEEFRQALGLYASSR